MYDLCDMKVEGSGDVIIFGYSNNKGVLSPLAVSKDETGFCVIKNGENLRVEFKDLIYLQNGIHKFSSY